MENYRVLGLLSILANSLAKITQIGNETNTSLGYIFIYKIFIKFEVIQFIYNMHKNLQYLQYLQTLQYNTNERSVKVGRNTRKPR